MKDGAEASAAKLFNDPLAWWLAEHERQRTQLARFSAMARSAEYNNLLMLELFDFLRYDYPNHVQEEEREWFPRLRHRMRSDDDLGSVLDRVIAEHKDETTHLAELTPLVESAINSQTSLYYEPQLRQLIVDFAKRERQHLALENAVIVPIARLRFAISDRLTIARAIALRRGYPLPPGFMAD